MSGKGSLISYPTHPLRLGMERNFWYASQAKLICESSQVSLLSHPPLLFAGVEPYSLSLFLLESIGHNPMNLMGQAV